MKYLAFIVLAACAGKTPVAKPKSVQCDELIEVYCKKFYKQEVSSCIINLVEAKVDRKVSDEKCIKDILDALKET